MNDNVDRRQALQIAAATGLAVLGNGSAAALTVAASETQPPLAAMLPGTRYFEVDSKIAGARYAVWVTTPPLYEREAGKTYPVVYQPDGNRAAPMTAPHMALLRSDPIFPIRPFILVSVGYAGDDASRVLAVRARDLLPPGEALPPGVENLVPAVVEMGILDRAGAELYVRYLRAPAADKFLAFLINELHPFIVERFRGGADDAGLHGYSYGGLFAAYVALRRTALFRRIGAGSPGILPRDSKVLAMYDAERATDADHTGRMLHMTVGAAELTAPSYYQPMVGAGTVEFIARAGQSPLRGLAFSSRLIEHESHASGHVPSWFSFLRTCYRATA